MQKLIHYSRRFREISARGMDAVLAGLPKCHYGMLEGIHYTIQQRGSDGQIYVSALVKELKRPAPAVSRDLRALERAGLIERSNDAADRRKIFVRLTPEGERCRVICEDALLDYAQGVMGRISPERMDQLMAFLEEYEQAVTAEIAARQQPQGENTTDD